MLNTGVNNLTVIGIKKLQCSNAAAAATTT
jgi:hypothetical protein